MYNPYQKQNNDKCQYECKKYCACEKIIVGILKYALVRIVGI